MALAWSSALAQEDKAAAKGEAGNPGRRFLVAEPITTQTLQDLSAVVRDYLNTESAAGRRPTLIFEIASRGTPPGQTSLGTARDLIRLISRQTAQARFRVVYVAEPLTGYAALAALAGDELVMGPAGAIGPVVPPGEILPPDEKESLASLLARDGVIDRGLILGLLSPEEDLRRVITADGVSHFVFARDLEAFRQTHPDIREQTTAWPPGGKGVLTAELAADWRVSKRTIDDPRQLQALYRLDNQLALNDPSQLGKLNPVWIDVRGMITTMSADSLRRRILQARQAGHNLFLFEFDSNGGMITAADTLADTIAQLGEARTVAYVHEAVNVATLPVFACDEIVMRTGARLGDIRSHQTRRNGSGTDLSDAEINLLADRLETLAKQNGHNPAIARAMVDPGITLVQAKDNDTGAVVILEESAAQAQPQRYAVQGPWHKAGDVLGLSAEEAVAVNLASAKAENDETLLTHLGLSGQAVPRQSPTWVDSLVTFLTTPFMSAVLLFVGLFMLVVELKLPGVGIPAITSLLAFLLFFWSHYLGGTATGLEIILFVVGLLCLLMELFIFPGVAVFGATGLVLMLLSIIMASHTFIWPSDTAEYRELRDTLTGVVGTMAAVAIGAVLFVKYVHRIPVLNKMVLGRDPEPFDPELVGPDKPIPVISDPSLLTLVGQVGRATTPLRPLGKARFGDILIDVDADGRYIEPGQAIEVVEVRGFKVIVRPV
ncbi:protein of unknown function DUF107 [Isosphaera pallida ATCC 43644]|uniref:Uncharacterized protein n=1 Tax=Isosphaera pallida (strain ATCC 43644 / DSM 9630 / IS1B) TaxID=575540 RepID=E8R0T4_ISOPI|nr:protein of unknown function DUF107 [Isosphaera pallida ATCC 43644]